MGDPGIKLAVAVAGMPVFSWDPLEVETVKVDNGSAVINFRNDSIQVQVVFQLEAVLLIVISTLT